MNPRIPWSAVGVASLLVTLALAGSRSDVHAAEDDAPMRTEDVVRMLVRGLSPEEVLSAIRTRPGLFDVSPEMQEELRLAGVSDELIEAMIERMAELNPPPEPLAEPEAAPADPRASAAGLTIRLAGQREAGKPVTLRLQGLIDFRLREAWQLDPALEETPFEDLALFLVCRTSTHVPDHWRSKSPLGRDFISMPRHRMLVFLSAREQEQETTDEDSLELELPTSLKVDLDPGEVHDLSLGIALQAGGRYLRWTDDGWDEFEIGTNGASIQADVRSGAQGQITGLEVRFARDPRDPATE